MQRRPPAPERSTPAWLADDIQTSVVWKRSLHCRSSRCCRRGQGVSRERLRLLLQLSCWLLSQLGSKKGGQQSRKANDFLNVPREPESSFCTPLSSTRVRRTCRTESSFGKAWGKGEKGCHVPWGWKGKRREGRGRRAPRHF